MENLAPSIAPQVVTGNPKTDNTLTIIVIVTLFFSALNGLITFIKFLEEREIAREKMRGIYASEKSNL